MWKKLLVTLIALVGTFSVGYAYFNFQMNAAPIPHAYYAVGDTFERNNQTQFLMGGRIWTLFYTDQGIAYIYNYDMTSNTFVEEIDNKIRDSQNDFLTGVSDDMGEFVKHLMLDNIRPMSIAEYDLFTINETDFTLMDRYFGPIWLNDRGSITNERVLYWKNPSGDNIFIPGHQNIMEGRQYSGQHHSARYMPLIKINLPQKGIIKSILADQTNITKYFYDSENQSGMTMVNIDTVEGEVPGVV